MDYFCDIDQSNQLLLSDRENVEYVSALDVNDLIDIRNSPCSKEVMIKGIFSILKE